MTDLKQKHSQTEELGVISWRKALSYYINPVGVKCPKY